MKRQQNNSTHAWTLHVVLLIAVLSLSAVLLASSFNMTPVTSGMSAPLTPVAAAANTNIPVLVVTADSNPFSKYYSEMLKAEGLNAFQTADIGTVTAAVLANYDTVLLGEVSLTPTQVTTFTDWVNAGGNLIAMKPDKQLAALLGLTDASSILADEYLLVNTASNPGAGIVNQTIQFHGNADLYSLSGATSIATLYSNATTATTNPAVTTNTVGPNGGRASAFAYDLAKSVVYTRQGNPAWAGLERDGHTDVIRPDDLFFPNYVDLNKVQIPQADEQQRLLANMITEFGLEKKPLPRFWYLPYGNKAAIVYTLDDHATPSGIKDVFNKFIANSPANCSVTNWECLRGTSWFYLGSNLNNSEAATYYSEGFEMGVHVQNGCGNFNSLTELNQTYTDQLNQFQATFTSLPAQTTHRYHCIPWSDWLSQARAELAHNIRYSMDYYYWPPEWVNGRPGFFTGSGIPMRFADIDGTSIDVYQGVSQLVNENGINYDSDVGTLLANATGSKGYYGFFGTHDDYRDSTFSDSIINASKSYNVPVISAIQALTWLDGRNGSSFSNFSWDGTTLNFTVATAAGSTGLQGMLPVVSSSNSAISSLARNGTAVPFTTQTIKGISYAFFSAAAGDYVAIYNGTVPTPTPTPTPAYSLWDNSTVPAVPAATDDSSAVELGTKFSADVDGQITGFKFYKGITNTGLHTGHLWTGGGQLLATASFTNETASGWQEVTLGTPVTATANTTYIVSYGAPNGNYAYNAHYFATGWDNPPLHSPASAATIGGNGIFGTLGTFPTNTFHENNYWVDVIFQAGTGPTPTPTPTATPTPTPTQTPALSGLTYNGGAFVNGTNLTSGQSYTVTAQANTNTQSVVFNKDGAVVKTDSASPFDFTWTPTSIGTHTLVATPWSSTRGTGTQGTSITVTFNVVKGSSTPTPTPTPTATPCATVIACENTLPGDPPSDWQVNGAGDPSIQGFATQMSVTPGQTESFKIKTPASSYHIDILRVGYYQGNGARKVASDVQPTATLPQSQPACQNDSAATGLIDCGNWAASASWTVPPDAVSGLYLAHLVRDDTGGDSLIPFVVRNDASHSDILFQTDDETWQAYNSQGGNSLYSCTINCPPGNPQAYKGAAKVSYNRPWHSAEDDNGASWFLYAEYPMIRFLERNGYDISYTTGVDASRTGYASIIAQHKLFMSTGHDEYWSGQQRTNVEVALAGGVNLAFFSGNEVFWATRWEPSIDPSITPNRTLVTYKETHYDGVTDPQDPPTWTGTWMDPRFSPPANGGFPQNALTGQLFDVNSGTTDIKVPSKYSKLRFWRNTPVASLASGQSITLDPGAGTLGYEWDVDADNGFRPPGLFDMSATTNTSAEVFTDYGSNTQPNSTTTHHLTLYRAASGALVFGAGTVQWSFGLDNGIGSGNSGGPVDAAMQQATVNLFADMGNVQPATLMGGLTAATPTTDTTPPTTTITSAAPGATLSDGAVVTISGTAADAGGGVVAGVEVSTDGGNTWHPATTMSAAATSVTWSYSWIAHGYPATTINARAVDDSGNLGQPSQGDTVNVTCPCSIWGTNATPKVIDQADDGSSVNLGVKFQSSISGTVTGIRFYKASANTGTHIGQLWTAGGQLLASATFTNETGSGWQEVDFSPPVTIDANTTYIASYFAPSGHYSADGAYFYTTPPMGANPTITTVNSPPLQAPRNTNGIVNGVYSYAGGPTFPTETFNATNYWVDPVFSPPSTPTPTPTPTATPTVQVTVQTSPAGLTFSVDGAPYTSAQTFAWVPGSSHIIATTSPQPAGTGVRYVWSSWTGGGAISHAVAPTTNTSYTANFNTQYFLTMTHGTGGTVTPASAWKPSGATVSITATPTSGYSFTNWTGSGTGSFYTGTNNPASITMNGAITENASFAKNSTPTPTPTATPTPTPSADVKITVTDGKTSIAAGAQNTYTITVTNAGPAAVSGASVTDSFPTIFTGVTFTAVQSGGATGFTASGTGNITDTVDMPAASKITYTAKGKLSSAASGTLSDTATVTAGSGPFDPNTANNTATDSDTIKLTADLKVTLTDGKTTAVIGSKDTYTIVVTNAGPSDVSGAVVQDMFPATFTGVTFTATQTGGATGFTGSGTGDINDTVNMPAAAKITYKATGTISTSASGSISDTATVTSPTGVSDPNAANNTAIDTDTF